jgi:hypothetical protein
MSLDAPAANRRAAAIRALLTAPTIAAAAAQIGVNEKTLDRWLADASFAAAVRAAQRRIFACALGSLHASLADAVATLRAGLAADPAPPPTRVRAAIALIDLALRAHDTLDVEERLSRLEGAHDGTLVDNGRPTVAP